jgi:hypothetical protein
MAVCVGRAATPHARRWCPAPVPACVAYNAVARREHPHGSTPPPFITLAGTVTLRAPRRCYATRVSTKVVLRAEVARARLAALGLSQSALAAVCELDIRTVQRWFAGQPVRLPEAERVASALCIGTADLFDGVPEHGLGGVFELFAAMSRLPVVRNHPSAQVMRRVEKHFGEFMAPLSFHPQPRHGLVAARPLPASLQHRFGVFRVHTRAPRDTLRITIRLAASVLVERAEVRMQGNEVWLLEIHTTRSMRALRRDDGSFDLWYWIGVEASELLFVSHEELAVEPVTTPPDPFHFDMSSPSTAHAVCIRPAVTHLASAGLPRGFDRVLHRDVLRVEVPEPAEGPAHVGGPAQPRTTPG